MFASHRMFVLQLVERRNMDATETSALTLYAQESTNAVHQFVKGSWHCLVSVVYLTITFGNGSNLNQFPHVGRGRVASLGQAFNRCDPIQEIQLGICHLDINNVQEWFEQLNIGSWDCSLNTNMRLF